MKKALLILSTNPKESEEILKFLFQNPGVFNGTISLTVCNMRSRLIEEKKTFQGVRKIKERLKERAFSNFK